MKHPKRPSGPIEKIEVLADAYAVMLGKIDLKKLSAPYLAALGVMSGAVSKKEAAEAVRAARGAANTPELRLIALDLALRPLFARGQKPAPKPTPPLAATYQTYLAAGFFAPSAN